MKRFGGERMKAIYERSKMEEDECLESKILSHLIEYAQKQIEGRNFAIRKNVLQYDDVMNKQRMTIYSERMKVLKGEDVHQQVLKYIPDYVAGVIRSAVNIEDMPEKWSEEDLNKALENGLLPEGTNYVTRERLEKWDYEVALQRITKKVEEAYEKKISDLRDAVLESNPNANFDFGGVERNVLLRFVDREWIDHIDAMDQLRKGIGLRATGQIDPIIAYKQEGFAMFDEMVERIQSRTIEMLLKAKIEPPQRRPAAPVPRIYPSMPAPAPRPSQEPAPAPNVRPEEMPISGVAAPAQVDVNALKTSGNEKFNPATMKKAKKPGPNDPCPCGSGLKYKKCHGKPF